jgi:restriction system protein
VTANKKVEENCPKGCLPNTKSWENYALEISVIERKISEARYTSPLDVAYTFVYSPTSLILTEIPQILSHHCNECSGYDLLKIRTKPQLPSFPLEPLGAPNGWSERSTKDRVSKLKAERNALAKIYETKFVSDSKIISYIKSGCANNDNAAISKLFMLAHRRNSLPKLLSEEVWVEVDVASRIALATVEVPNFKSIEIEKYTKTRSRTKATANERKKAIEEILYVMAIRSAYLIAKSDAGNWVDTIAVNINQKWTDKATGHAKEGITASLQAQKSQLLELNLSEIAPKDCFKYLKGIATPSTDDISAVRPIFVMDTDDSRIVKNRDVSEGLDDEANLAAMPWEDFEHLVRQLFEWEFGKNGVEVKVTRASRDKGVDAIMFDPDPLRGGKYVLQAKRYTRTVGSAAVRELYGTIQNEGANRGILVTTATFGPDAYEFSKDKPISLVDGPNLVALLRKHGKNYKINLAEARAMKVDD